METFPLLLPKEVCADAATGGVNRSNNHLQLGLTDQQKGDLVEYLKSI